MPVANGSFELESPACPGLADGWSIASVATLQDVAAFGDPPLGHDAFAWVGAGPAQMAVAIFDLLGEAYEDFHEGWLDDAGVNVYYREMEAPIVEAAEPATETFSWSAPINDWAALPDDQQDEAVNEGVELPGYVTGWSEIGAETADFSGESVENFSAFTEM